MHWFVFSWIVFYNKLIIPKTELDNTALLSTSIIYKTDGNDYKTENNTEIESQKLETFRKNVWRMHQLRFLENPSISIFDKIQAIEQEKDYIYAPNIQSGGLWDDFDF